MHSNNVSDIIRRYLAAYTSKDRKAVEDLLSDDFTFTSPLDDHIDRATYFERCWPYSEIIKANRIEQLFENGNEAFVRYECEPTTGPKFWNTEFIAIEEDRIKSVEVYFGSLPDGAPEK